MVSQKPPSPPTQTARANRYLIGSRPTSSPPPPSPPLDPSRRTYNKLAPSSRSFCLPFWNHTTKPTTTEQRKKHHVTGGFAGTKRCRYVDMAVSRVAEGSSKGEDGAFGRLLFLLLLVCSASAGINECYELFNESLSYALLRREPFLAAPASYWYRFSSVHHHHHHRQDATSMRMMRPMETPMVDYAYGTLPLCQWVKLGRVLTIMCLGLVSPVSPVQAFTGSLEYPYL